MEFHGILLNFMECPSGVSIEFHGVLKNLKCTTFHQENMLQTIGDEWDLSLFLSTFLCCRQILIDLLIRERLSNATHLKREA